MEITKVYKISLPNKITKKLHGAIKLIIINILQFKLNQRVDLNINIFLL